MKSQAPLKTVLIGFGSIAAGYAEDPLTARYFRYATHAQVLSAHPGFSWAAVIDSSPAARDAARLDWNIPITVACAEEIPADYAPEVAVLATPPQVRQELIEKMPSLRAVLIEKPIGMTIEDSTQFLEYCRDRSILVQVNYWRRADELSRRLAAGYLQELTGSPQAVFGVYGNGFLNNGGHMVDYARMLFGEVKSVDSCRSAEGFKPGPIPGDRNGSFLLNMESGLRIMVQPLDFRHYRENGLDIWGEKGRLSIMQEGIGVQLFPKQANRALQLEQEIASDQPRFLQNTVGEAFYHMYSNLADAVHNNVPLWSSADSALETAKLVHAIMQQMENDDPCPRC